ncbi:MAG: tRNA 4-thiouridine(8) synthase ThiI [Desulfobacterales bacterium]|nr:MAG: tRNA 4-thiouridine(8) synthase ThiI [Desulfobacterales bacterium]
MEKRIIIHYSEIGLKGKNRRFFENSLIDNIRQALKSAKVSIHRRYGRIIGEPAGNCDMENIKTILGRLPGIAYFSFGDMARLDIEEIKQAAIEVLDPLGAQTFGIAAKRSNKLFPMSSDEINRIVGRHIVESRAKKVDLKVPDVFVYIEICEKEAFVYCHKYTGIGGFPVGTTGRVVGSLSGGIDSPVAALLMMKRGCRVIFAHIRNQLQSIDAAASKIDGLVAHLTNFQLKSKLYIVPFEAIQREIIMRVPSIYRMIVYRRFMMRVCSRIAERENALAIITGDSAGQVASQTLENINCIYKASAKSVLTPLIGMNKDEIVKIAKKIGTYDISTLPYPDCCSYMIAPHPETRAKIDVIKDYETAIKNAEPLVAECVKNSEIKHFQKNN